MRAHYRFSLGKLKVLSHEKVKQGRSLRLGGAGAMVAALEDFITQAAAQVSFALEERAGELEKPHFIKKKKKGLILNIVCGGCRTFCTKSLSAAKTCRRVAVDWLI